MMIALFMNWFSLQKEEDFLNRKAQKGWLVSNKIGCCYFFKRHNYPDIKVSVEIVPQENLIEANDYFHLLLTKTIRKPKLTIIYYFTSDEALVALDVQRDDFQLLAYYKALKKRLITSYNYVMIAWALFYTVTLFTVKSIDALPFKDFFFYSLFGLPILLGLGTFLINKQVKIYQLKTGDYSTDWQPRYIVTITTNNQNQLRVINQQLAYLGNWDYRLTKKATNYYYLYSNTSETTIKADIADFLDDAHSEVSVIHPMALFPIGWF